MINSKAELSFYIKADRMMNRGCFDYSLRTRIKRLLIPDLIMKYLEYMRKVQYYSNTKEGGVNRVLCCFYKWRYNKLGLKLGFSIGYNVFGYGLVLPHYGTIVVGGSNRIGNYAVLHTSTCISDNGKVIGNGLYLSTGAKITSKIILGNGITIGANSLVNKSCEEDNYMLGGMPAKKIKEMSIWYIKEGTIHKARVEKIEMLKRELFEQRSIEY